MLWVSTSGRKLNWQTLIELAAGTGFVLYEKDNASNLLGPVILIHAIKWASTSYGVTPTAIKIQVSRQQYLNAILSYSQAPVWSNGATRTDLQTRVLFMQQSCALLLAVRKFLQVPEAGDWALLPCALIMEMNSLSLDCHSRWVYQDWFEILEQLIARSLKRLPETMHCPFDFLG